MTNVDHDKLMAIAEPIRSYSDPLIAELVRAAVRLIELGRFEDAARRFLAFQFARWGPSVLDQNIGKDSRTAPT